jgi:hypothetical protein
MATYYWYTTGNASRIKPGWRVPSWNTDNLNGPRTLVELVFEEVRGDHYPSRPSRLVNKFVCPDYPSEFCEPGDSSKTIFEVEVRGKTFEANADHYARALDPAIDYLHRLGDREELKEKIRQEAHKYWRGSRKGNEVIVDGTVTIVGPVEQRKKGTDTMNLRKALIKLAHGNPALRKDLLPLLKEGSHEKKGASPIDIAEAPYWIKVTGKKLGMHPVEAWSGIHGYIVDFKSPPGFKLTRKVLNMFLRNDEFRWVTQDKNSITVGC